MTAERGNMVSLSAGVIQMTTLEANVILAHLDSAILAMDATLSTVTRLRADILGLMPETKPRPKDWGYVDTTWLD